MSLAIGSLAPDFSVPNHENKIRTLADYAGRYLILYFYPKDDTPGCTREAIGFTELVNALADKQAVVVGVSCDSVTSHQKFRDKHGLTIELLSDELKTVCEAYDVWQEKKNYGKTYMGIVRSTVLIDFNGVVQKIWKSVKVDGHPDAVYQAINLIKRDA
tara:strand:+ start:2197 stop:2673 length:477 start_codon:yes stop_codon:yes gene_type:complete